MATMNSRTRAVPAAPKTTFRRIRHQVVQRYRIPLREIFKGINQWSTDQISFDHLSGLPTRSRIIVAIWCNKLSRDSLLLDWPFLSQQEVMELAQPRAEMRNLYAMKSRPANLAAWEEAYLQDACDAQQDGLWFMSFLTLRDQVKYFLWRI